MYFRFSLVAPTCFSIPKLVLQQCVFSEARDTQLVYQPNCRSNSLTTSRTVEKVNNCTMLVIESV
jgi:hypothetical protein